MHDDDDTTVQAPSEGDDATAPSAHQGPPSSFLSFLSGSFVASMFDDGTVSHQRDQSWAKKPSEGFEASIRAMARGDDLLHRVADVSYWQALAPGLTITEDGRLPQLSFQDTMNATQAALPELEADGYLVLPRPQALHPHALALLADGIRAVQAAGWPPVFALVYDQAWQILQAGQAMASVVLGEDCVLEPSPFIWCLSRGGGARAIGQNFGLPHRDFSYAESFEERPPGSGQLQPSIMNMWVPIVDATPANGPLHVLPKEFDPCFHDPHDRDHMRCATPGHEGGKMTKVRFDLGASRSLPCPRGSLVTWYGNLIHWGGRCSGRPNVEPRISIACNYKRKGCKSTHLTADGVLPDITAHDMTSLALADRLRMVAKSLLIYQDWFDLSVPCPKGLIERSQ